MSWKDRKPLVTALKGIYRAVDAKAAEQALTAFETSEWGQRYPAIGQSWRHVWSEVVPFFAFPEAVRRIIYTTNATEALNSKLRRAVRARGHFPSDDAATKLLYLILNRSEKEWKMPPREWSMAKAQFAVIFGERFIKAIAAKCSTARPHTEILTVPCHRTSALCNAVPPRLDQLPLKCFRRLNPCRWRVTASSAKLISSSSLFVQRSRCGEVFDEDLPYLAASTNR